MLPSDGDAAAARLLVAARETWPVHLRISGTVSIEDVFEELVLEGPGDDLLRPATQLATRAEAR